MATKKPANGVKRVQFFITAEELERLHEYGAGVGITLQMLLQFVVRGALRDRKWTAKTVGKEFQEAAMAFTSQSERDQEYQE